MRRLALGLALALAGIALPAVAHAQSFTILTQNVLRFGHGSRLQNQCNALDAAAAANIDIIVLQEVMVDGYPCLSGNNNKGVNGAIPANFAYVSSAAKGRSSYVEYYGILYRTTARNNQQITFLEDDDTLSTTATFMRPPYAARFQVTDNTTTTSCDVWIVDIHSIFGKRLSERQDEAQAMKGVYQALLATNKGSVIVAGDWNLPADDDDGFDWARPSEDVEIEPNELTSLTTTGAPSSAYDHAVHTLNTTTPPSVTLAQVSGVWTYTGTLSPAQWRTQVSDHMGVRASVSLTC